MTVSDWMIRNTQQRAAAEATAIERVSESAKPIMLIIWVTEVSPR